MILPKHTTIGLLYAVLQDGMANELRRQADTLKIGRLKWKNGQKMVEVFLEFEHASGTPSPDRWRDYVDFWSLVAPD